LLNETYLQGELQCMFKDLNVSIQYDEVLKACKQLKQANHLVHIRC